MPVRDRDDSLTREQRHLDARVISPGQLDAPPGGDPLQLRIMGLETVGDPFRSGPGRRADRTVAFFQDKPLAGLHYLVPGLPRVAGQ
jgi:hypothetical protein